MGTGTPNTWVETTYTGMKNLELNESPSFISYVCIFSHAIVNAAGTTCGVMVRRFWVTAMNSYYIESFFRCVKRLDIYIYF